MNNVEQAEILRDRLYDDHVAEDYCGAKVPNAEWTCTRPRDHPDSEYHEAVYYTQRTGVVVVLWSNGRGDLSLIESHSL